ncbi:hypothetical protein H6F93_14490 [Leptolyngbya sp. FACHB-671]|nr:hypothetical protein [Leptolyngbya sp. FACHB-671]MBD2068715.1 hypothetical protein [Leptolyngbya sp. FACHB-671]
MARRAHYTVTLLKLLNDLQFSTVLQYFYRAIAPKADLAAIASSYLP